MWLFLYPFLGYLGEGPMCIWGSVIGEHLTTDNMNDCERIIVIDNRKDSKMSNIDKVNEKNKKAMEKEQRRLLYENNKAEYKKQREKFVRGVSKTFRDIQKNNQEEMEYLNEQTKLAYECEENGEK